MSETITFESRVESCLRKVRTIKQSITKETFFKRDLGFESIDVVDLLFELEQEFKCRFPMRDFNQFVLSNSKAANWDFSFDHVCGFVAQVSGK